MRVFRAWLDEQAVAERLLTRVDGERRLTNLLHLGELLQAESLLRPGSSRCSLGSTPSAAAKAPVKKRCCAESDAERVQIVTIHTSKGLEYPWCSAHFSGTASCSARTDSARCHDADGQPLLDWAAASWRTTSNAPAGGVRRTAAAGLRRPDPRARPALAALGPVSLPKAKKDGSLPDEGLHSSALARLLHGRELPGEQPLTELGNHRLVSTAVACVWPSSGWSPRATGAWPACRSSRVRPAPRAAAAQRASSWRSSAAASTAHGASAASRAGRRHAHGSAGPRRPGDARCRRAGQRLLRLPRGARAGTCLHAILEDWARGKGELAELVEPALKAYGLPWTGGTSPRLSWSGCCRPIWTAPG